MLPAMSRDEILTEIIERPWQARVAVPGMRLIERPGWRQLVTPAMKRGGMNEVARAQLGDDADAVIDQTIAQYRALGCKFVWRVGPDSTPADLPARLAQRGLVPATSCGMARSTEMTYAADPRITIEHVDATNVDVCTQTMAAGWGQDPAGLALVNGIIAALPDGPQHLFLARYDGEPAATAGSGMSPRSVYLLGGVTLERFRGHGIYRALVAARLAHARALGITLATSHARADTSAPILERLGFETLCRYDNFLFAP